MIALRRAEVQAQRDARRNPLCRTERESSIFLTLFRPESTAGLGVADVQTAPVLRIDPTTRVESVGRVRALTPEESVRSTVIVVPPRIDSARAVSIARRISPTSSTVHCVIPFARGVLVEFLASARESDVIGGYEVLVPTGDRASLIGIIEFPPGD